jgi:UDP-glucuronate 4-epimerase
LRALVTGAAGFIGSHLCDALLAAGHEVVGIDCFSDYYSRRLKEQNLFNAREHSTFAFKELDLVEDDLLAAVSDAELVFHLADRSGIRSTRRNQFDHYVRDNLIATQRLLEVVGTAHIRRFVYAGSSSIYGAAERLPTKESNLPSPLSVYGLTKLAAENMVHLYGHNHGLPAVTLRYFNVYGPRQRPDMAIARFIQGLAGGTPAEIFGDGEQTRDFTFVDDVVDATLRAAAASVSGKILNVGGGSRATVNAVLRLLEEISGSTALRAYLPAAPEDHRHGGASINLARQFLAWEPRVSLRDGLARQWSWFHQMAGRESGSALVAV